jgi:hypothetical protein
MVLKDVRRYFTFYCTKICRLIKLWLDIARQALLSAKVGYKTCGTRLKAVVPVGAEQN